MTPTEIVINTIKSIISSLFDAIPLLEALIAILIIAFLITLKPKFDCFFGFHHFYVIKATNMGEGKMWEIHEKCKYCGYERTDCRSRIGRI